MEPQVKRIVDRIVHDAKKEAKSVLEDAQKSAELMLEKRKALARQKAGEKASSILKRTESEVKALREMVPTDAKRKAGWMVLSEKERLVTSVFDKVKTKLEVLSRSEKYIPLLEKMILDAGIVLGGEKLEVSLNKLDSALPLKFSILAKAIAEKTGKKTQITLSKEKNEAFGGAVVKTVDGRIVVDNTFEAILKRRERDLRFKIAKILFG
jgi:vacuolar-type H+-ATPase subunit E/Vma4